MIFGLAGVGGLAGGGCFLGFGWGSLLHPSTALLSATHSPSRIWTYSANVLNLMPIFTTGQYKFWNTASISPRIPKFHKVTMVILPIPDEIRCVVSRLLACII